MFDTELFKTIKTVA